MRGDGVAGETRDSHTSRPSRGLAARGGGSDPMPMEVQPRQLRAPAATSGSRWAGLVLGPRVGSLWALCGHVCGTGTSVYKNVQSCLTAAWRNSMAEFGACRPPSHVRHENPILQGAPFIKASLAQHVEQTLVLPVLVLTSNVCARLPPPHKTR